MNLDYNPPLGYRDYPFIYVYDANQLNGPYPFTADAHNQMVSVAQMVGLSEYLNFGDLFQLRRIVASFLSIGPQFVTDPPGGMKFRDPIKREKTADYMPLTATALDLTSFPLACSWPVWMSDVYGIRGEIPFDLSGVKLRYNCLVPSVDANTVPISQLLFQGVRRVQSSAPDNRGLLPGWNERMDYYSIDIPFSSWWYYQNGTAASGVSPVRQFSIQITDGPFELLEIRTYNDSIAGGTGCGGGTNATVECARIQLYDWSQTALMNAPVNLSAINSALNSGALNGPFAPGSAAGAGALCPPIVYPNRSFITFNIQSLLNVHDVGAGDSQTITIVFVGRRRWR
jgi:hypothetical protein